MQNIYPIHSEENNIIKSNSQKNSQHKIHQT